MLAIILTHSDRGENSEENSEPFDLQNQTSDA
jgi:hypothetical protein